MTHYELLIPYRSQLAIPQKELGGLTPLQFASKYGETNFIAESLQNTSPTQLQLILEQKTNQNGFTALHYAAFFGKFECVELLLAYGASLNAVTHLGMKPIHLALNGNKNNKAKQIELFELMNSEPLALSSHNNNGDTLAHLAAQFDLHQILTTLDDKDVTFKNKQGMTPLLSSVLCSSFDAMTVLLAKSDIGAKDYHGRNALHYAVLFSTSSCLKQIIPFFALLVRDQNGSTPMDYAIKQNDPEKIQILLEAYPQATLYPS